MKLGLALPISGGSAALEAARIAEGLGFDGVFVFDHYFTRARQVMLPANDPLVLLGALSSSTTQIAVGSLVYRAAASPVDVSAHAFRCLTDLAGTRLIAGVGIGGREFEDECRYLGLSSPAFSTRTQMTDQLAVTLTADGIRIWIGGYSAAAAEIAERSGACLNLWNAGIDAFARRARESLRRGIEISWAGPWAAVPTARGPDPALIRHFDALKSNGASWVVIAPTGVTTKAQLSATYRRISKSWVSAS